MSKTKQKFSFVGSHAEDIDDGRVLQPGETVSLTEAEQAEPSARRLIAAGKLSPHKAKPEPEPKKEGAQ